MFYVYVLYSTRLGSKYIGLTSDLRKRFSHHNAGFDRWSKRGIPWQLIYYEAYCNETDARLREKFLKSGRGREVINHQLDGTISSIAKVVPPIRRIRLQHLAP